MKSHLLTTQWQRLPKDVILRLQGEKLHRYLRDVVVPFSAYYRDMFQKHGLRPESIRSVDDLEQIPFTSKADLVNTPESPQRSRDFVLIPDQQILARRPARTCLASWTRKRASRVGD